MSFAHGNETTTIRILLVEDNDGDADLVLEHLDMVAWADFAVRHCTRLAQAEEALRLEKPDVVLLDLSLPDGTGVDVVSQVRDIAGDAAIVVLTGSADESMEAMAVRTGAQEYLHKNSLDSEAISRSIRHAIERQRLMTQIRALVMAHVDATLVVTKGGTIRFANHAAESLFQRGPGELLNEHFPYSLNHDTTSKVEMRTGDGSRILEIRSGPFEWMDEPMHLASLRDITARERAAELQSRLLHADRLASIGQLAAGVAHEVNNPATFVIANLHFLQETLEDLPAPLKDGAEAQAKLQEIHELIDENLRGMERIVKIVRNLRVFSRIDSDDVEQVNLNEILTAVCDMTGTETRHRARLIRDFTDLPAIIGDQGKLTQVFTNLLVNAAQAIEPGHADKNEIHVSTRRDGDEVKVTIQDTGCGMPEEVQRRIFEPFYTTKPRDTGTGLGLPLSAEIVRQHGGEIHVTSAPNLGTTFVVSLAIDGGRTLATERTTIEALGTPNYTRRRILIVDDEPHILLALKRMLSSTHGVVTAEGGERGIEILREDQDFDVLLFDLMMPVVDGIAVHAFLEREAPQLISKVIFLSGGAFTAEARAFINSGDVFCLEKPVDKDELMATIERISANLASLQ